MARTSSVCASPTGRPTKAGFSCCSCVPRPEGARRQARKRRRRRSRARPRQRALSRRWPWAYRSCIRTRVRRPSFASCRPAPIPPRWSCRDGHPAPTPASARLFQRRQTGVSRAHRPAGAPRPRPRLRRRAQRRPAQARRRPRGRRRRAGRGRRRAGPQTPRRRGAGRPRPPRPCAAGRRTVRRHPGERRARAPGRSGSRAGTRPHAPAARRRRRGLPAQRRPRGGLRQPAHEALAAQELRHLRPHAPAFLRQARHGPAAGGRRAARTAGPAVLHALCRDPCGLPRALAVRLPRVLGAAVPSAGRKAALSQVDLPRRPRGARMTGLLEGKNVLVTGAANSRSIAWSVALAIKKHGGIVALTYQAERLRRRVQTLADELGEAPLIECDVSSDEAVRRAIDELAEFMPVLDGMVHSIAWAPAEDLQGCFVQTSRAGFAQANDISSYSLIATAREARRLMTRGGGIVTMTYAGSWRVVPNYNVMGPAKASLESAVRYLAADLGPDGIRVNAVSAGPIATVAARTIKDFSGMLELLESHTPLRRNVTAEEVADATVFLLSDLSRAITGEVVHVDAGAHATI